MVVGLAGQREALERPEGELGEHVHLTAVLEVAADRPVPVEGRHVEVRFAVGDDTADVRYFPGAVQFEVDVPVGLFSRRSVRFT